VAVSPRERERIVIVRIIEGRMDIDEEFKR
jgi:hypothetical protein